MSYVKPWWMHPARLETALLYVTTFVVGLIWFVIVGLSLATFVYAGGPVALTWDQANDCSVVTGWELLQASVTTAQPNPQPTSAVIGVSIPNTGTPPCGLAMTRTVNVSGIGPTRFWLRAVAAAGKSGTSNNVDAALPFAPPTGLQIVVP